MKRFPYYFDEDLLVCSFVGLCVSNTVGSGVKILYGFFVRNILILMLLGVFSLAIRNNPVFSRKDIF